MEGIITLGVGGGSGGVGYLVTSGLTSKNVGDAKNLITLGIGAAPGKLLWFITSGIEPIVAQRALRLFKTQPRSDYVTQERSAHKTNGKKADEL